MLQTQINADEVRIELEAKKEDFYNKESFSKVCNNFIYQFTSRCLGKGSRKQMNLDFAVLLVFLIKNQEGAGEMYEFKTLLNNLATSFFEAITDA